MKKLQSPGDLVRAGLCIGCGSCVAQEGRLTMDFDMYGQLKPMGSPSVLRNPSEKFTRTCPFSPSAANEDKIAEECFPSAMHPGNTKGRFLKAYVGYAAEKDFRMSGSSGGMVSWVAAELFRKGLIDGVAHVVESENPRFFRYRISRTPGEIERGAKSRYYPVEMSQVLEEIKNVPGKYAVIGIPCFIKAVHLLRRENRIFRERIRYTLGLFCGHMKSARFVESLGWQMGAALWQIRQVEFRYKDSSRPANWYNARLTLNDGRVLQKDWWHLADGDWGAGFFMSNACNFCDDVISETADISFGDAWVEPYSSDGKGTNVVVARSEEMLQLLEAGVSESRLQLKEVNSTFISETQAAGLRQRREGLAYRLTWKRNSNLPLLKRVKPDRETPTRQRKLIYRIRHHISAWSHGIFWLARTLKSPRLYVWWAACVTAIYHGLAYHRGRIGKAIRYLGIS